MEYRLLGPVEVVHDGELVELGPRKQRALLCLLLLHANRVVTTDRILEELWGDDAAGKENALWVAISRLRTGLEPARDGHGGSTVLLTRDHGYMLQRRARCDRCPASGDGGRRGPPAASARSFGRGATSRRGARIVPRNAARGVPPRTVHAAGDRRHRGVAARGARATGGIRVAPGSRARADQQCSKCSTSSTRFAGAVRGAADALALSVRETCRRAACLRPAPPHRSARSWGSRPRPNCTGWRSRSSFTTRRSSRPDAAIRDRRRRRWSTRSRVCAPSAKPMLRTSSDAIGWSPRRCAESPPASG